MQYLQKSGWCGVKQEIGFMPITGHKHLVNTKTFVEFDLH